MINDGPPLSAASNYMVSSTVCGRRVPMASDPKIAAWSTNTTIHFMLVLPAMFTSTTKYLRKLSPPLATAVKQAAIYSHYWMQAAKCRFGYMRYGNRYKHNILFIAGTPKSGTTWLIERGYESDYDW
jgi:hypothetical protein